MSQRDKLVAKLKSKPKDFTYQELTKLLSKFGYREVKPGKTGGSRRRFVHEHNTIITLHKPHPGNVLKRYQVEQVLKTLTEEGLI